MVLYAFHGELTAAGYIVVLQDVRGKHKSEGVYVMNRPLRGPLNPTETDHSTDAFDTLEWLVEQRARVQRSGRPRIGISYDGFTALDEPDRPSIRPSRPAVPINPMVRRLGWVTTGSGMAPSGRAATLQYIHQADQPARARTCALAAGGRTTSSRSWLEGGVR